MVETAQSALSLSERERCDEQGADPMREIKPRIGKGSRGTETSAEDLVAHLSERRSTAVVLYGGIQAAVDRVSYDKIR